MDGSVVFTRWRQCAPPYVESQKWLPWQRPLAPRNQLCLHRIAWPRKPTPRIKQCVASYHTTEVTAHRKATRRSASGDRTERSQFKATGQPVSRTQASDAMTSRLPRYEAKCVQRRCFQWGLVPLSSDIKGTEQPAANLYWYHSKGNWLCYNFAAENFYIMKLCSRLLVLYCWNSPKDDKFR